MNGLKEAEIRESYLKVVERIKISAESVGRNPTEIKLVVVTKGHPIDTVQKAIDSGIHILGENYVQEAVEKMGSCSYSRVIEWHMIGHIQSRKTRLVCEHFDWVESVDNEKIANRLNNYAQMNKKTLPVLLECNVSGETSKYGFPCWQKNKWEEFSNIVLKLLKLENLDIRGLMTMPPLEINPENVRPYFRELLELQTFLKNRHPEKEWGELSMGMSGDFEVAIQEGATIVRIGTAILGPRSCAVDFKNLEER